MCSIPYNYNILKLLLYKKIIRCFSFPVLTFCILVGRYNLQDTSINPYWKMYIILYKLLFIVRCQFTNTKTQLKDVCTSPSDGRYIDYVHAILPGAQKNIQKYAYIQNVTCLTFNNAKKLIILFTKIHLQHRHVFYVLHTYTHIDTRYTFIHAVNMRNTKS